MRIAVVQFHVDPWSSEVNWSRMEEFMKAASERGADLVPLTQTVNRHRGFVGGGGEPGGEVAENVAEKISKLASTYKIDLVPGTVRERDPVDNCIYNNAYYVDKDGAILLHYRKIHLWGFERKNVTQGNYGLPTAKNRFGIQVGLCICWDLNFPECFREMALNKNAQLVIVPAHWCLEDAGKIGLGHDAMSEVKFIDSLCITRAFENEICLVYCNTAAPRTPTEPSFTSAGRSQITVPFKGPVAHLDHNREDMIIADVDIKAITQDAESVYWIKKDWDSGYIFGRPSNSNGNS
ncbi:hypothetical protein EC973_006022 [Apophysomyces ossiformis]|uniref:CN hydrolase domain-containing protein n=1 Tax=Apophysomyces ossiformis TaxID=679940 RepID=A0A8H7EUN4_9FUNG|nr:hypothetical protein EC973_006022 [Apophysomyces ossiformis]